MASKDEDYGDRSPIISELSKMSELFVEGNDEFEEQN